MKQLTISELNILYIIQLKVVYLFHEISLTAESRRLLHQFGSTQIDKLHFRDSFVLLGQRGLTQGSAVERVGANYLSLSLLEVIPVKLLRLRLNLLAAGYKH